MAKMTTLDCLKELIEICRVKCSPLDEVILPNGKTNHAALIDAIYVANEAESPWADRIPQLNVRMMTEAEAKALRGKRNLLKIPVKSCPVKD